MIVWPAMIAGLLAAAIWWIAAAAGASELLRLIILAVVFAPALLAAVGCGILSDRRAAARDHARRLAEQDGEQVYTLQYPLSAMFVALGLHTWVSPSLWWYAIPATAIVLWTLFLMKHILIWCRPGRTEGESADRPMP